MKRLPRMIVAATGGTPHRGLLVAGGLTVPCALGRSGIAGRKREGDGATPRGAWRPVAVYWRADRLVRPATALPARPLKPEDGWCDDPADRRYNRPVRLPYGGHHERLWRADRLYDVIVVLDYNLARPKPRRRQRHLPAHCRAGLSSRPKAASRSHPTPCAGCLPASTPAPSSTCAEVRRPGSPSPRERSQAHRTMR